MTTSSVHPDYLPTSSDTITISALNTSGNVTIGNTTGTSFYYTGAGIGGLSSSTITIANGGAMTGTISSGSIGIGPTVVLSGAGTGYEWQMPTEWIDKFPDWDKVKKMCEEYPGLKIAFEKFQTTYKLVVDHYDTPEDKRPKP